MTYKYNNSRIKEFAEKKGFGGRTIANKLKMSNDKAPRSWLAGAETIRMDHFLKFVNTFKIDIREFFYKDDILMSETVETPCATENTFYSQQNGTQKVSSTELDMVVSHIQEKAELEKKHIREMMQKDLELSHKEVELRKEIRKELKEEYNHDKEQIIESYETRLRERDADVARLQQQLAELTVIEKSKAISERKMKDLLENEIAWEEVK